VTFQLSAIEHTGRTVKNISDAALDVLVRKLQESWRFRVMLKDRDLKKWRSGVDAGLVGTNYRAK